MAVKHLMKSGGLAALAAALALLAVPASADAQERGWRTRGGEALGNIGGGNDGRRGGGWGQREQAAPPVQTQPQVQAQAQVQAAPAQGNWNGGGNRGPGRSWNGRSGDGSMNSSNWRAERAARAQSAPAPQAQVQTQTQTQAPATRWNSGSGWQQRRGQTSDPATTRGPRSENRWNGGDRRGDSNWTARSQQGSPGWQGRSNDGRNWRNDRNRENRWTDNRQTRDNDRWRNNNSQRWSHSGDHRRWNRDWRHDNRYNWHSWRSSNRDIFRWGYYNPPYRNYSYRRLSIGFYLDTLFFGSNYWINDPWQYRLPDAYGPYRWIRYYDDALLVDIYTGEVVDVIHDFFW